MQHLEWSCSNLYYNSICGAPHSTSTLHLGVKSFNSACNSNSLIGASTLVWSSTATEVELHRMSFFLSFFICSICCSFLQQNASPTAQEVEDIFDGNICRCTGWLIYSICSLPESKILPIIKTFFCRHFDEN